MVGSYQLNIPICKVFYVLLCVVIDLPLLLGFQ